MSSAFQIVAGQSGKQPVRSGFSTTAVSLETAQWGVLVHRRCFKRGAAAAA
eukprot:CAMPEP_0172855094 /NCGR_PEP_ID=MMETSP1075-20121228/60079_1 /TAXON_ID=2916 /ORGANISM="Ceratium fusus, Strain PA161109" /LENGTH=50 /DNA_ID=CAMNT_0013701927 /DNA_START=1 /DNA_END=150 /DNA_ORIENTATION=-